METSSNEARLRTWEIAGGLAVGALFLAPLLQAGPWDNEEMGLGLFSSQLHYHALFRGRWQFWLNDLGFGTPLPLGQRLDFHPLFALGSLVSLRAAFSAVWLVHVTVMVVYFLRLAAVSGIRPPVRTFLLACYVFSATSVGYFYQTDWLSVQIAWSLYPALVFYVRETVTGESRASFAFQATRLALLLGFVVLNSHPGYLAPLMAVLAVYVVAASPAPRARACLLAALALGAAVSAERAFFAFSEMRLFPAELPREAQAGYGLTAYARAAVAPLAGEQANLRLPFIGLVLGGCAVAGAIRLREWRDPHARACAVAFAAALLLGFAPVSLLAAARAISAGWFFRDPMLFFGLIAGGLVLQRLYESRALRAVVWGLVVVQLVQQAATIRPGLLDWRHNQARLQFYRHQGRAEGVGRVLAERGTEVGPRLYLSEQVRSLMRGSISRDGIHAVTDLVFLGLNPINGWFKGVSMDRLYPSLALMHGIVAGQREVIENGTLLDVLGIDLVLASGDGIEAARGLAPTDHLRVDGNHALVLFANRDAWPTAVLMTARTHDVELPLQPGCPHTGALCRDYTMFLERRLPDPVALQSADGLYRARFSPSEQERELFVSATYRPEWRASAAGTTLRLDPVAGAFLGVTVPPGVGEVELAFVPTTRIILTVFSGAALAALVAACVVSWWRSRSARSIP